MALKLWNANMELERLVKAHSEALASYEFHDDHDHDRDYERGGEREVDEYDFEEIDLLRRENEFEREREREREATSSVTGAILAEMENISISTSPNCSNSLSFFDDDSESLDPFMDLPHARTRSPPVACC